ncbi:MAG TPA: divalent-cation tolerance protein CutA [Kiritimatiellia bacterium]|nr:divalent-cation tolerance protein CutA [Kiritimatiellia bacterium]
MWVYMTAGSRAEARNVAAALVAERLAACVNILGPIESIYRWKGAVERGREVALVAKTRRSNLKQLAARVKALHSYESPCVVALPIVGGHPDFLSWIRSETATTEK